MIQRNLTEPLLKALSDTPVVFLGGARQTGKSTLAQWIVDGPHPARYITMDDASALSAARNDPTGFVEGLEGPTVLDEVQRAPDLFLAIKREVDRRKEAGRFLLTGSADILFLPGLSKYLAGRVEILILGTLSQGELGTVREGFVDAVFSGSTPADPTNTLERRDLLDRIISGGYPEIQNRPDPARRKAWFGSYLTTILQAEFPRLLSLLSARSGGILNVASLSRESRIAQTTLKRYLALLQASFLVFPLRPWTGGFTTRLVKSPKIYLNDTGLMAHLLGVDSDRLEREGSLIGPFLENFVVMELQKQISWSRTSPGMFYFRTHTGCEIDIVLEDSAGRCVGIEIKASSKVSGDDLKGLKTLKDALKARFLRGFILYTGRQVIPFAKDIHALPLSALWQWNAESSP